MLTYALNLSDHHFGEETDRYNIAIAKRRVASVTDMLPRKAPEKFIINFIGDIFDGEGIFPTQNIGLKHCGIEQLEVGCDSYIKLIKSIRKKYPKTPITIRSCRGNHGRMSQTAAEISNWDNLLIRDLHSRFANNGMVKVVKNYGISFTQKIGNFRAYCIHKAERHASTNAQIGKILRRSKKFKADLIIAGHWHSPASYRVDGKLIYIINGSLVGWNEYSEQIGLFDPPAQSLIIADGNDIKNTWLRWE